MPRQGTPAFSMGDASMQVLSFIQAATNLSSPPAQKMCPMADPIACHQKMQHTHHIADPGIPCTAIMSHNSRHEHNMHCKQADMRQSREGDNVTAHISIYTVFEEGKSVLHHPGCRHAIHQHSSPSAAYLHA